MIKVIHVVSDTNIGGAGRWVLNFLKEVNRERFAVKIALPRGSRLKGEVEKLGVQAVEVPGMADRSLDIKAIRFLYGFLKGERPDIVHTHASLSARIAAKMAGIKPIVYTKHCIDQNIPKGIKKKLGAMANGFLSDRALAVADAAKENLMAAGIPEHRITVLHNGVEKLRETSSQDREKTRAEWGIEKDAVVIGIVARLEAVKGHGYFIQAARQVVNQVDSVKFLIVGTGSAEQALKEQVSRERLDEHIVFTGHLNDIAPIMNIMDIHVISSLSEALCLSIIEAMSLGKPCIATDTGGNSELVRDGYNGILVPVKDVGALAGAMLTLVNDETLRQGMGEKGRMLTDEHFTSRAMTKKLEEIYSEIYGWA